MAYDPALAGQFEAVRDPNEAIVWAGKPHFFPYLFSGIPILIFGCIWGSIDYFGFIRNLPSSMNGFAIPFFTLHLIPFWGSVLYMLWLLLSFHNTAYAISNRRVLVRSGVFGVGYKTIDLSSISNLAVTVGPVESAVGAGTLRFNYGVLGPRGTPLSTSLTGIDDPYAVYRQIHEATSAGDAKASAAPA